VQTDAAAGDAASHSVALRSCADDPFDAHEPESPRGPAWVLPDAPRTVRPSVRPTLRTARGSDDGGGGVEGGVFCRTEATTDAGRAA
jgi:hypothetical protein